MLRIAKALLQHSCCIAAAMYTLHLQAHLGLLVSHPLFKKERSFNFQHTSLLGRKVIFDDSPALACGPRSGPIAKAI